MDIKIEQSSNDSKKCSRCKEVKNLPEFYKNRSEKWGFRYCKSCKTQYTYKLETIDKFYPKITCDCGKTIYKHYLNSHLKRDIHKIRGFNTVDKENSKEEPAHKISLEMPVIQYLRLFLKLLQLATKISFPSLGHFPL